MMPLLIKKEMLNQIHHNIICQNIFGIRVLCGTVLFSGKNSKF